MDAPPKKPVLFQIPEENTTAGFAMDMWQTNDEMSKALISAHRFSTQQVKVLVFNPILIGRGARADFTYLRGGSEIFHGQQYLQVNSTRNAIATRGLMT
jgi:hypothetical protein